MKPAFPTTRTVRWVRIVLGCCLLLVITLTSANSQQFPFEKKTEEKKTAPFRSRPNAPSAIDNQPVEPGAVEVAFTDGSNLKLQLRDEKIVLATPYGKLTIAVADIQRIEFATRVSDEDDKRIHAAIIDLGSTEFSKREEASAQLLKLREKAYPALLRAAESKDLEVVRRAQDLSQQIANSVPAELLAVRPKDVVYTADSMIAGRIESSSLKAHTAQFGVVQMKLADARSLRSQALESNPMRPYSTNMQFNMPMGQGWGGGGLPPGMRPGNIKGMNPGMRPMGSKMPMQAKPR